MDNTSRPEQGNTSPKYYLKSITARPLTKNAETNQTDMQVPLHDNENITVIQSNENASVSTSADADYTISIRKQGYDNRFNSVISQDSQFLSPQKVSRDFERLGGSRMLPVLFDKMKFNSNRTHNRKRSQPNYKITTKKNQDHKRSKLENCGRNGKDVSSDSKHEVNKYTTLELNVTSPFAFDNSTLAGIDGHTESNNISKIGQYDNAPSKISDSIASARGGIWSVDDILATPGTSSIHRNENTSNLCGEAYQSLTCRVCKEEINKHETEKNTFKCCNCSDIFCEEVNLQIHSYTPITKTTCEVCEKEHAVGNSHNSEQRCPECNKKFYCRTRLYEHFLDHIDYFRKHCWVCRRTINEHISEKPSTYVCCVCGFESKTPKNVGLHNLRHLPRFYCKLCKEEYSTEERHSHGGKFTCLDCPNTFKCKTQLEDHYFYQHFYSENCRICERNLNEHFIYPERYFQCCDEECLEIFKTTILFQNHQSTHKSVQVPKNLRFFKCDSCERKFVAVNSLRVHKYQCKALPFKCEICEAKFHTRDIQHAHYLLNHKQALYENLV